MWAFGYDIASESRRRIVRRKLREETPYWQESFFALETNPADAMQLLRDLCELLNPTEDGFFAAPVHREAKNEGLKSNLSPRGSGIFILGE